MNRLNIMTKCYVNSEKKCDLNAKILGQFKKLLDMTENVTWTLLISNTRNWSEDELNKFISTLPKSPRFKLLTFKMQVSCSGGRWFLYDYFVRHQKDEGQYYMNIDADDTFVDINNIVAFTESERFYEDLIGYGISAPVKSKFRKDWYFDEKYFKKARRYCTTLTQTMFLFLQRFRVLEFALDNVDRFIPWTPGDILEPYEDIYISVGVAKYNKENNKCPFTISAICANLMKYSIHEGQLSDTKVSSIQESIQDELKSYGYLYVNCKFYKFNESKSKFINYNPYE